MIKKLFLDLNNFKANLGSVERGDSIELNIKLLDSEDYSRSKFRVLGTKADGKYVEQIEGLNLEEKDLKVVLEDQFVNCEGIVKLELNVVSGEIEITTKEFYFFVSNTMNAEIIDSADSIPTLEKVSKYVDDAVNNLDALKEASEDIALINGEFKEAEIKRKANELLRERSEKERVRLESIRTTEEADRIKAEAERKEAENNRKVAESNRKLAENTRKTNEAARVEAELNRQSLFEENEEIRNENENLRIEAEKERKLTFSNNNKFESERVEAEKLRAIAEDKRVTAEKARAKAEEERVKAETRRENTYTDFNDSEVERRNNEANRVRAEAERVNAESGRNELFNTNEEKRNSTFIESERTRGRAFNEAQSNRNEAYEESERVREEAFKVSEVARNEAEDGRVAAELLRVEAEKLRVAGEENRNNTFTQSEEERKATFEEAENARKVAESKRVKAESSRVEAEKLRVTAETGRVEAENLRVTAEEGRVAAETKREEGFNAFEGKINANKEELKNARSATTGEKFDTLDERIDCEVDRLNKKIEVSMLQQEDKKSHTIENTVDGMTTDMIVKGRTLQNLCDLKKLNITSSEVVKDGFVTFDDTKDTLSICTYLNLLKPNTTYTICYDVLNLPTTSDFPVRINDDSTDYNISIKGIQINSLGFFKTTFTTGNNICKLIFYNNSENKGAKITYPIILEGETTYIPNYFEGVKSFGEAEDKISILSSGKNLINFNEIFSKFSYVSVNRSDKTITATNEEYNDVQFYVYLRKGKTYKFSYKGSIDNTGSIMLGKQKGYVAEAKIQDIYNINDSFVFNHDNGIYTFHIVNVRGTVSSIQLEEGKQSTIYEPYKCDKKDILLQNLGFDEGLRGLNLTVYDELNDIRNVAIKRIDKYKLTGEEEIYTEETIAENNMKFVITTKGTSVKPSGSVISDNFIKGNDTVSNSVRLATNNKVIINIDKAKLSEPSVEGFKTWLKANPTTVYYELVEPVETPLDENINVKTFGEKTYVAFENAISGTSSFKAPVDSAGTISRLNRENRALEEENRSLRQDFESTTLSLTDSDLELVKQNVDMDFRLMEVEFALDIPQSTLSSKFKKKGEVKSMARTPYEMMKIVILSGDYDREDYIHKVGKYYERGRMTKEEYDELMSLMTADEVISK